MFNCLNITSSVVLNYQSSLFIFGINFDASSYLLGTFFLFMVLSLFFATIVSVSDNIIYSLLSLVAVFVTAACCLGIFGIEFLAIIYVIVYAGGIAVLFSIVTITLNLRQSLPKPLNPSYSFLFFYTFLSFTILSSFLNILNAEDFYRINISLNFDKQLLYFYLFQIKDVHVFSLLYSHYYLHLFLVAFLLLASMVGSIMLCLISKPVLKKKYD